MAGIRLEFGSSRSIREWNLLFEVEAPDLDGLFFSLTLSEKERNLLLGLSSMPHRKLIPLLLKGKNLTFSWTSTNGKSFSMNEKHEDIPSIEGFLRVGTLREFLGAVLSERDRY